MKRINIFLISLLLIVFASCSKGKEINRLSEKGNYGVAFSIKGLSNNTTRASQAGGVGAMKALERETNIANLYAVVYQGEVFQKAVEATSNSTGNYSFDMGKAGSFNIYLVANPDATLINKMKTEAATPGALKNLIVTQEVGANNAATNFLMTADPFSVTTQAGQTVTHATAVSLVRLAARVDFYNTVPELEMIRLRFKNRVKNSVLVDSKTHNRELELSPNTVYETAQGLKATDCIGAIYSYENNEKGSVAFTLEANYKGAVIQKEVTFDNLPLKRNHLYHVIISEATTGGGDGGTGGIGGGDPLDPDPDPNNLTVNIKVVNWNDGALIEWKGYDLIGGTPTFTATGTGVTSSYAQSLYLITVPTTATTVTITALGDVTYPVLENIDALPSDITFTAGSESKTADGRFQRTYTINVGANPARSFKFAVLNPLDKDLKQEFTLQQNGVIPPARPKMAIEYVAEYNVNAAGDGFTNSHANDQSGYFNGYKATGSTDATYSPSGENIFDATGLQGYHLPSRDEWRGIVSSNYNNVSYSSTSSYSNVSERISVNGVTKTYTADYRNKGNGITYALRFKDNTDKSQLSAWRYEYAANPASPGENMLKITARYLGEGFTGSIADIEKESYWNANNADDVTRLFPAAGWKNFLGSLLYERGAGGYYWSTEFSLSSAWYMYFDSKYAGALSYNVKTVQFSVRPFSDN